MNTIKAIDYQKSKDTISKLHLLSQMIGKLAIRRKAWRNHSWHTTLMPSPHGFMSQILREDDKHFQLELDLVNSKINLYTDSGMENSLDISRGSISDSYQGLKAMMGGAGISLDIYTNPCEIPDAIPFEKDDRPIDYDRSVAKDVNSVFKAVGELFEEYRVEFTGKSSPVHLFWGAFDLAVSRFSGASAPPHPGGMPGMPDWVAKEAYSHEVASIGFWPGNEFYPKAAFYAYLYPGKDDYAVGGLGVEGAYWNSDMGEWLLDLDKVAGKEDWKDIVMRFTQNTFARAIEYSKFSEKEIVRDFKGAHS